MARGFTAMPRNNDPVIVAGRNSGKTWPPRTRTSPVSPDSTTTSYVLWQVFTVSLSSSGHDANSTPSPSCAAARSTTVAEGGRPQLVDVPESALGFEVVEGPAAVPPAHPAAPVRERVVVEDDEPVRPRVRKTRPDYEDEDDDRPVRRRRSDEDEEDDRPGG